MKKKMKLMGFAMLALSLSSCSQNETFENEVQSNLIKFRNLNERIPKSREANDNQDNYGVYATLNNGNASGWFMDQQEVDGKTDIYSPLKYWPLTGTIDFYAFAPYNSQTLDLSQVAWDAANPNLNISYTVPTTADEDFTIVKPVTGKSSGEVTLVFVHQLSKVEFKAELTDDLKNDNFELTLNSVTLKVPYNKGTNTLAKDNELWSNLEGTNVTYTGSSRYMIMPQPADGTEITLNVSITHNSADYFMNKDLKTYKLTTTDLTAFLKSTHYVFKVTIGDATSDGNDDPVFNVIRFNSNIVSWLPGSDINLENP